MAACQGCSPSSWGLHLAVGFLRQQVAFLRSTHTLMVKSAINSIIHAFIFLSFQTVGADIRLGRAVE